MGSKMSFGLWFLPRHWAVCPHCPWWRCMASRYPKTPWGRQAEPRHPRVQSQDADSKPGVAPAPAGTVELRGCQDVLPASLARSLAFRGNSNLPGVSRLGRQRPTQGQAGIPRRLRADEAPLWVYDAISTLGGVFRLF